MPRARGPSSSQRAWRWRKPLRIKQPKRVEHTRQFRHVVTLQELVVDGVAIVREADADARFVINFILIHIEEAAIPTSTQSLQVAMKM